MYITEYNIELRDIHLYAHHGVMSQEREVGAWFTIDIKLTLNRWESASNDQIEDTVSYADIYDIVKQVMEVPANLLEHVCKKISTALYNAFSQITEIEITLCKDTPPMGGDRLKAAVTLKSKR